MSYSNYSSTILNLGTRWKIVSFTPRESSPWCALDRRLSGPQSQSRRSGDKNIPAPEGNRTPVAQPVHRLIIWLKK